MPSVSRPYGLDANFYSTSAVEGLVRTIRLTTNSATGFFYGDIVNVGAGVITPVGATPTTTRNGNSPSGIFVGCQYTTPQGVIFDQYLPPNAFTNFSALGPITVQFLAHPDLPFTIQANGPVALTAIGKNAALTNFGQGVVATKKSRVQLDAASIATTNTLAVRIIAINETADNVAGDNFTDVQCIWNQNVHTDRNILGV